MGYAIDAFSQTFDRIQDNPVHYFGVAVLVSFALAAVSAVPLLSLVLSPVLLAGLYGYLFEYREAGDADFETFKQNASEYWGTILIGNLLIAAVVMVVAVVLVFTVGLGVVAGTTGVGANGLGAATGGMMLVLFVLLVVGVVAGLAIQFFMVAIVREDVGAMEGFRTSIDVFSSHAMSVVGFNLLSLLVTGILVVLPAFVFGFASATSGGMGASSTASSFNIAFKVLGAVASAFAYAYQVEFYDRVRPGAE